ncbi:hypothetical protein VaNZ11_006036, partial [Volvox africanus]
MLAGPLIGGYLAVKTALWTCIALTAISWIYVVAVVPECAPGPLAQRAAAKAGEAADANADADASGTAPPPPLTDSAIPVGCGQGSPLGVADSGVRRRAGREVEQEEDEQERLVTVETEALAAAEVVSLISSQSHLMSGGSAPSAAADADAGVPGACAVYGTACYPHNRVSTCAGSDGNQE